MASGRSTDAESGGSAAPRSTDVVTCRADGGSAAALRPDSHSKQYISAPRSNGPPVGLDRPVPRESRGDDGCTCTHDRSCHRRKEGDGSNISRAGSNRSRAGSNMSRALCGRWLHMHIRSIVLQVRAIARRPGGPARPHFGDVSAATQFERASQVTEIAILSLGGSVRFRLRTVRTIACTGQVRNRSGRSREEL